MTDISKELQQSLTRAVQTSVSLEPVGRSTYRLVTPFVFDDGDMVVAYVEQAGERLRFSDHGYTIMHVSYDVEVTNETRTGILDRILATHDLEYKDGEIFTTADIKSAGPAFWDFVQGVLKTADISLWKVERAASLFMQEFQEFMETRITPSVPHVHRQWHDPRVDESGLYRIPWVCKNGGAPLFVFPILSTAHCDQAVISCLKYENADYEYKSFAAFADIDKVNNRSRNQLLDIGTKTVTSFDAQRRKKAEQLILQYFKTSSF